MKLLSANQVKTEKDKVTEERIERTQKIRDEEIAATKSLNQTRAFVASEKDRLDRELAEYASWAHARKKELDSEIEKREKARAELMKPIHEIRKEAERKLTDADRRLADLEADKSALAEEKNQLSERLAAVIDRENALPEKEAALDRREEAIASSEAQTRASSARLAEEWAKYHIAAHELATAQERATKAMRDVEVASKANDDTREENRKEAARLRDGDRAIRDKYTALEQAKKHLGIQ